MHHVSNAISIIKTAVIAKKLQAVVQNTKFIVNILDLLEKLGYIRGFVIINKKQILVLLKYIKKIPAIRNIRVISTPGRRVYLKKNKIIEKFKKKEIGTYIISTSRGLLTADSSVLFNVGGEVVLKVF